MINTLFLALGDRTSLLRPTIWNHLVLLEESFLGNILDQLPWYNQSLTALQFVEAFSERALENSVNAYNGCPLWRDLKVSGFQEVETPQPQLHCFLTSAFFDKIPPGCINCDN